MIHPSDSAMPHRTEAAPVDVDVSPIQLPRSSGILLHISSLPGRHGIGDFGADAFQFADFLVETGQRIWQVLPLVPIGLGNSPYSSPSTFAVNPLFISPDRLAEEGLLETPLGAPDLSRDYVEFEAVWPYKQNLLIQAFRRFESGQSGIDVSEFDAFTDENAYWLDDYTLFAALKSAFDGRAWTEWPAEFAGRDDAALNGIRDEFRPSIRAHAFWQFLARRQWARLKRYCNERGLMLFGDLPIYVAHDSADVWARRDLFFLDENGRSTVVAGVPPDYFSETGQRWGNPIYRWELMKKNGYAWWTRRFENIFEFVDLVRLDHFRAFAGYWEIPAAEETAVNGRWVPGPGSALFRAVEARFGPLPLVAENLGLITADVTELMHEFGFPGMAVLEFAFGDDAHHPFLPHNLERNVVAYTGTHDNNTMTGWWDELRKDPTQTRLVRFARGYLGLEGAGCEVHRAALRAMMASRADWVISPLQDVLGLGAEARMNTPGRRDGNWTWRFRWEQLTPSVRDHLSMLTAVFGRSDRLHQLIQAS